MLQRRRHLLPVLEPLGQPAFRRLMLAIFCFTAAVQMQTMGQGWLVFHITGSNVALGVVTSMWSVALFLFSPVAGVVADRLDRRLVLKLTWGGSGMVFAVISLLILLGRVEVWHLAVAAALNGVFFSFNLPARFALISQMVSEGSLVGAIALNSLAFNLNGILFPLLGGGLIDLVGPAGVYVLVSVLYLIAVAVVGLVPAQEGARARRRRTLVADMVAGVRVVRAHPVLIWLMALGLAAVVLGQSYTVLLPDLAAGTLHVPASGLGLLMAMLGLGGLVGNLAVANLGPRAPMGRLMLLLGGASGVALLALAGTWSIYPALVVLFVLGFTGMPLFTINQTLVQRIAPPEVRGRVLSLYMLTWGAMPLGLMVAATLADSVGLFLPLVLGGAAMVIVMLLVARSCPALLRLTERG
ncbi:MAG: MFS transporter [Chloroflexi bacterium]|nr:MFS transporter [Chloroflexota bacterium]